MKNDSFNSGSFPNEMAINQRIQPMPDKEQLLQRNSFGSVNENKWLDLMLMKQIPNDSIKK